MDDDKVEETTHGGGEFATIVNKRSTKLKKKGWRLIATIVNDKFAIINKDLR